MLSFETELWPFVYIADSEMLGIRSWEAARRRLGKRYGMVGGYVGRRVSAKSEAEEGCRGGREG